MRANQFSHTVSIRRKALIATLGAVLSLQSFANEPGEPLDSFKQPIEPQVLKSIAEHQASDEPITHDPTVPGTETVRVGDTLPLLSEAADGTRSLGKSQSLIDEPQGQTKSTLKLKPVAGPIFGRSNRKPLIKLFGSRTKKGDSDNDVQPGPPLPRPKSLNHPQIVHLDQQQRNQTAARPNLNSGGWVARNGTQRQSPPKSNQSLPPTRSVRSAPAGGAPIRSTLKMVPPANKAGSPAKQPTDQEINTPSGVPSSAIDLVQPTQPRPKMLPKVDKPAMAKGKSVKISPKEATSSAPKDIVDRIRADAVRQRKERATAPQPGIRYGATSPKASIASRARTGAQATIGDLTTPQSTQATPNVELDYVGIPKVPIQVSNHVRQMKPSIERVLQYFYDNPEIANGRSNWGMMHAMMVYGIDTRVSARNRHYSTIAWVAGNNICRGQRIFTEDAYGIKAKSGVGLQGHQAQLLAILSLCDVPTSYPLYAGNNKYSVADLIESEQRLCKSREELTFTLIGLSHYLDTDATWRSGDGQRWDIERLIREELAQPIVGTACGGTHRLMGFAHALRKRREEGKPITGQWARAEYFLKDFVAYTYQLQNRDGSMSTEWFEARGNKQDMDRKIQTTGHMVEFLLTVTPDSQLQDPRLVRAVQYLAYSMARNLTHEWKIGPKGHALRSLAMYHQRVFQSGTPWKRREFARATSSSRQR